MLNTDFSNELRSELEYDLVFDCTGFKFEGPKKYMQGEMAECVDKESGQIYVNEYLQITNVNPNA